MTEYTKWEYKVEFMGHKGTVEIKRLKELGEEGWELTAIADDSEYNGRYIFKRPILTPSSTINY